MPIIINVAKPKSCISCPFSQEEVILWSVSGCRIQTKCKWTNERIATIRGFYGILDKCPIEEIK